MTQDEAQAHVQRIADWFSQLGAQDVARMGDFYTPDAYFKDPFNEVRGVPAIQRIFSHMYVALDEPHFVVTGSVVQGAQCFLTWDFRFRMKRFDTTTLQVIRGGSHIVLADDGRIASHRDYWDAAEELWEKVPLLGGVLRALKKRLRAH